ncbi:SAM-dependent methyltransferase [Streptomyces sp. PSKA30]|uniref:SAM-dependent methyltransferase n=1 Tax=Streptomyces sp. PSKA30 TaxID=2874597 RepID=UPI0035B035BE
MPLDVSLGNIDADLRNPDVILEHAARTLDFTQPVALMLLGITAHVTGDSVHGLVGRLMDALPSGSHLEPGVVSVSRRRCATTGADLPAEVDDFGGVARKP